EECRLDLRKDRAAPVDAGGIADIGFAVRQVAIDSHLTMIGLSVRCVKQVVDLCHVWLCTTMAATVEGGCGAPRRQQHPRSQECYPVARGARQDAAHVVRPEGPEAACG